MFSKGQNAWIVFRDRRRNEPFVTQCKITKVEENHITLVIPSPFDKGSDWVGSINKNSYDAIFTSREAAEKALFEIKLKGSYEHADSYNPFVQIQNTGAQK